jgi:hypothetical protein
LSRASLYDFRDLDLMIKLADAANGDHHEVSAQELAEELGFDEARTISTRLAWMKRYGMLTYSDERHAWSLTRGGERVVEAKLRAAQERTITAVPDESLVTVMSHVTSRYRLGDPMIAQMLRREFLFGTKSW